MTAIGTSMKKILITCPQMQRSIDQYRSVFAEHCLDIVLPGVVQQLNEDELIKIIGEFDGMIAGDDPMSARVLEHATKLRIISKWGVGIDNIDLDAAAARGIRVTNTPGMFGTEVADVTIGYLILLARQLHRTDQLVRLGEWPKIQGRSLAGKTLGVIGLGNIGLAVVKRALAMDMNVVGYDVTEVQRERATAIGATIEEFAVLLRASDYVALCCPLTKANRHMINAGTIRMMKPGTSIINTARGQLIEERALVRALDSGRIASAALDVFEDEPLPIDSQLRRFQQVILGTHNSSNTLEGTMRVNQIALRNLLDGLRGDE